MLVINCEDPVADQRLEGIFSCWADGEVIEVV
jgi:hypothetical protein